MKLRNKMFQKNKIHKMSHAHRKNSVTVPLGGLNATNQNFAKSLRFNNKSENSLTLKIKFF